MKPNDLGLLSIPIANGSFKQVEVTAIRYIKADNIMTRISLDGIGEVISTKNFGYFVEKLDNHAFIMQVHKSYMVNLTRIREYNKTERCLLLMQSDIPIPVSRRLKPRLMEYLHQQIPANEEVAAKLIVNDKQSGSQIFLLKAGEHIVGRKSVSRPCDVMIITEDKTMSRNHFKISTTNSGHVRGFTVSMIDPLKRTVIDGIVMDTGIHYPLRDGSVIRAGETDMIFRTMAPETDDFERTEFVSKD